MGAGNELTVDDAPVSTAARLVRESVAILVFALSSIGQAISMAALIFAGPLEVELPRAIASFTIAAAVLSIFVGLRSRVVPAGTSVQDGPAIVLVAIAATVGARGGSSVLDVFVLLALTTAVSGAAMWLLGRFRLGGLVRYMPIVVVGAFLAGTGYLLFKGGLDVMVGFEIEFGEIGDVFTSEVAKFWVPGVVVGVVVWAIGRSALPVTAMSAAIVLTVIGFYVVVLLTSSIEAVEQGGWLIGPFDDGAGFAVVTPSEIADADWGTIVPQLPAIGSVVGVAIVALMLNVSGLSLKWSERIDIDAELRTSGVANLLMSPFGSSPGFIAISDSLLIRQLGGSRRAVIVAAGVLMGGFGLIGVGLIGYLPRLIVGALLVVIGLELLVEWVEGLVRSISKIEQVISIVIVLVIATVGILEGMAVGLLAACAVFIVRYSRVDPIRLGGSGDTMRSRVERAPAVAAALAARADALAVYELQGYLFFGSVTSLEERMVTGAEHLDAVVLDFRSVTGVDTSAYSLVAQIVQRLTDADTMVVLSAVDPDLRDALLASEPDALAAVQWAPNQDTALEATEAHQLELADVSDDAADVAPVELSDALEAVFEHVDFAAGANVFRQGEDADGMFIVLDGSMTAFRTDASGGRQRLRSFGRAALVGEIGLITRGKRTADIVADTPVAGLWLSAERYDDLRRSSPHLAFELHEWIMRRQAALVVSLSEGLALQSR